MVKSLNSTVELAVKANSFLDPINPKPGVMALGNNGVEFRASNGEGYIQIPWRNIIIVQAQVFFNGRYIRGFDIITDDNQVLNFVVADAKKTLRVMREHLESSQLEKKRGNFSNLFKRKTKK